MKRFALCEHFRIGNQAVLVEDDSHALYLVERVRESKREIMIKYDEIDIIINALQQKKLEIDNAKKKPKKA